MKTSVYGYSGKPLAEKLGITDGMRCSFINHPSGYLSYLRAPSGIVLSGKNQPVEFVQLFCRKRNDLETCISRSLSALVPGGMLWISWPKKSSDLFLDLTEDGIREVVLPRGWVDVKVCAIDATWSGLKFLKRKK